ncbi:Mbov_0121 family peptidase domain-containing ABC transporter [Mycoplasma sp. HS2188]|uniref:Mbov_0121 family peptidase domain-containing ABC transporter n=1 Tax=Mycoplasma sp. HS2188 TaxID=2976765 RepID=UPI0021AAC85F|nr:cysteine peptidase family C39 domain-containing protein [Mycoplasma sp. HS2188]MCT4469506.1 cysteine peptidase family C39 domain-containing protein [Mycoplasma sp. HS2188]
MRITKQYDTKDCGLHILQYLFKKMNHQDVDISYLKLNTNYSDEGINLVSLNYLANQQGINLTAFKCDFEQLISIKKEDLPIIIVVNENGYSHYLLVEKIKKTHIVVQDSRVGSSVKINFEHLKEIYTGVICFIEKEHDSNRTEPVLKIDNKFKALFNFNLHNFVLILCAIINTVFTFVSSFFIKIVFDSILPNRLEKTLFLLFSLFIWLNMLRVITNFIKHLIVKKITNKMEIDLKIAIFTKLNNLSINEMSKLTKNEIFKRISYISLIANYKANFVYSFFSNLFAIVASSVLLIWISIEIFSVIFIISLFVSIINFIFHLFIEKKYLSHLQKAHQYNQSEFDSVYGVNSFENDIEKRFLEINRTNSLINFKQSEYKLKINENYSFLFSELLLSNVSIIITTISTFLIFKNKLSLGSLAMILSAMSFFIHPVSGLTSLVMMYSIVEKHISMINFLLNLKNKKTNNDGLRIDKINSIALKNIKYGYETGVDLLNIDELNIEKSCVIVGGNGSGKSTLLNLLHYRFTDWTGDILVNNHNLKFINDEHMINNTILINNNVYIPDISIYDFLTLKNYEKIEEFNKNIEKYQLDELMEKLNLTLNLCSKNNATNFSSGQRQFIILLKLFTQKYNLILLDEAFENIDKEIFEQIKQKITEYQKNAMFIEVSHSHKYLKQEEVIDIEKINRT